MMIVEQQVLERILTVTNKLGIHARVATMMVQTMKKYTAQVTLVKDGLEVDARSVLGLLLLAATPGSEILVKAQGDDCQEAIQEISKLIQDETDD